MANNDFIINDDDFVIEDGILVDYNGNGGNVVIPDGVTAIDDYAFESCENLTSVKIPESVTSIGNGAFASCENLTSITIPDSVTFIGKGAFAGCYGLMDDKGFVVVKGVLYDYDVRDENATISETVVSICEYAVDCFVDLESIVIPPTVKHISSHAFYCCDNLKNVTFLGNETTIEKDAFFGCDNIVIHAPAGSYAEQYAKENNIPFVAE